MIGFETVTEIPGNKAHSDQIDAMRTRYSWAEDFCRGKDVVEIACGAGIGLGLLANNAKTVIGGDVDPVVLRYGQKHYQDRNIRITHLDACEIYLADKSVDVAICFEAIYYFPNVSDFLSEIRRILRPDGILLCSSVNCEWHGFNPSPYSKKYYSANEMRNELNSAGFKAEFFLGFEDNPATFTRRVVSYIRALAVKLHLVPRTMRAKEFLKKVFYGKLESLPHEITAEHGQQHSLLKFNDVEKQENYKYFYFVTHPL